MAQKPLLQAALEDAHARIRRLEQDNAQLHRELGEAHAARDLAGEHVNRLLGELHPVDPPDREPLSAWYAGAVRRPSGWRAVPAGRPTVCVMAGSRLLQLSDVAILLRGALRSSPGDGR
ncbi:hypothetical protein P0D72_21725 [Paraburkholderia sediminicola]|uniref:hypothetical protein n=1 Tax=Paraburkholderia sediminicola TaxID=458836 RepID=UPI0038BA4F5B